MALFEIENLNFAYPTAPDRPVLREVNLRIEAGEYVLLCGKSGCGKTTLLRHLKSVLTPHGRRSGCIAFLGQELSQVPLHDQSARIGFVMQSPDDQIVTDKVWHELAFGLESLGCDERTMRLRVAEMASYFGIQSWFHREVSQLSGGQKQLLNLASIMAMHPDVLILDEPTSQLDPIAASDFLNTVRKINRELGTTVLITEHRLEDIFPSADRVIVMENGAVTYDGDAHSVGQQLYQQDNDLFAALPAPMQIFYGSGMSGSAPLTVRDGRTWLSHVLPDALKQTALPETENALSETCALTLNEVWYRYEKDSPDVLKGVCAEVPAGSIYAIVGGNGSGKSTTLKAICGICRPYRGSVKIFGKALKQYCGNELFQGTLALLPQDVKSLFVRKTVREELEEMQPQKDELTRVIALCELTDLLDAHPYDLSGGEQQRTALAKVLLTHPKLLLMDEPTKGMDCCFKQKFADILCKLKEQDITIILVSHDVEFCAKTADLVSLFFDGQVMTTDTPRRFFAHNSFYTTAANRMCRHRFPDAVTADEAIALCRLNLN